MDCDGDVSVSVLVNVWASVLVNGVLASVLVNDVLANDVLANDV
jgi:hypothetical protein